MKTRRRILVLAMLVAVLAHACGREDIQIPTDGGNVGGPADGSAPLDGLAPEASAGGDAALVCGPATTCLADGITCAANADCCSERCEGSVCLAPGSCSGAGELCSDRDACCSGRCNPTPGSLSAKCTPYCLIDGAPCAVPSDCCSLSCHSGSCGGALCVIAGGDCTNDSDCCSGDCQSSLGKCLLSPTLCRAAGEDCSDSVTVPPCCGTCDSSLGRCSFGPGPCLPRGTPCGQGDTCCNGSCQAGDAGVPVCTSSCAPSGASCTTNDDCCGGICGGVPLTCRESPTCKVAGSSCSSDAECCTGACAKGRCGCD